MKYPTMPHKPYAPYKPQPPTKQIEDKKLIGTLSSQEDSEFTLESLEEVIYAQAPDVKLSSVKISWEIKKEYGYYDDVSISLDMNIYSTSMIDNPRYDEFCATYLKDLDKYKKDYAKYKLKLVQYNINHKKYKKDIELWTLEHAKATIKKLQSKMKKAKK